MNKKKKAVNHSCYPDKVIERLARCFYPAILESFNNEEDQKAFAAWKADQVRCSAKEKQGLLQNEIAIQRQKLQFQPRKIFDFLNIQKIKRESAVSSCQNQQGTVDFCRYSVCF